MILSTIQSVAENLSKPVSFIYANLFEANGDLDIPAQSEGKEIVFVYVPPLEATDDTEDTPLIHTLFPLQFFLLRKLQAPTIDYKSKDIDPVIDEMMDLAREFFHNLNDEDIIEHGVTVNGKIRDGVDTWKFTSEYSFTDYNLFGVGVTCEVPVMENKTGCI